MAADSMAADWKADVVDERLLKKLGLPADGKWFYRQGPAESFQQSPEGSDYKHNYAWDNPSAKRLGSKIHGMFKTAEDFLKTLHDVLAEKRHGYEWFRDGTLLKMYGDVEWKVPVENPERIQEEFTSATEEGDNIMEAWKQQHRKEFERISGGVSLSYIFGIGSRITEDNSIKSIKLSYHVVVPNVCFYNDAPGRKLVYQLMCLAPGILPNRAMDPSPYAQNQKYRTLLSSKGSDQSHTPLIFCPRLSDNPDCFTDLDALVGHVAESTVRLDELMGNPELQKIWAGCVSRDDVRSGEVTSSVRPRNRSASLGSHNSSLREMAKKILCLIGDGDNEVGEPAVTSTGGYSIQCYNPLPAGRPCPWNPLNVHHSNNSTMFVDENGDDSYCVKLTCHSGKCHSQNGKKRTGVIANLRVDEDQNLHLSYLDRSLFERALKPKVGPILEKQFSEDTGCSDITSSQVRKALEKDLLLENGFLTEYEGKIASWIQDWVDSANSEMVVSAGANTRDSPRELTQEQKARMERSREAALARKAQLEMKSAPGQKQLTPEQKARMERNREAALALKAQVKSSPGRMDLDQMEDNGDVDTSNQSEKGGLNEISGLVDEKNSEVVVTLPEVDILRSKTYRGNEDADKKGCNLGRGGGGIKRQGGALDGDDGWDGDGCDEEMEAEFRNPSYLRVKTQFEKECFKINDPFCYVRLAQQQSSTLAQRFSFLKHSELRQFYSHVSLYTEVLSKQGTKRIRKDFIDLWIRDPTKRGFEGIETNPVQTTPGYFNIWPGFLAARLPPVGKGDVEKLVQPFIRHFREVLAHGDDRVTEFLLDHAANLVQRPAKPTQVIILIEGEQGCGKDINYDFLRECVIGEECSFQTDNPEQHIFGKHASCWINKVLVQISEAQSFYKLNDRLKNAVTAHKRAYEPKGKNEMFLLNMCNFVVTTNNKNVLKLASKERRTVWIRAAELYLKTPKYFVDLGEHYKDPRVARAVYQFLMERDLSKYSHNFQKERPITEAYRQQQSLVIPLIKRYASAIVNDLTQAQGLGNVEYELQNFQHMYEQCKAYAVSMGLGSNFGQPGFGKEMTHMRGFESRKSNGRMIYKVNCVVAKTALQDANEFDEDATLEHLEPRFRVYNLTSYVPTVQDQRPNTSVDRPAQLLHIPLIKRYASAIINDLIKKEGPSENEIQVLQSSQNMHDQCRAYAQNTGFPFPYTLTGFGKEMSKLQGFRSSKKNGKNIYNVDCSLAKEALQKSNEFDEEATLGGHQRVKEWEEEEGRRKERRYVKLPFEK